MILEIKNLTFSYRKNKVLKNINFSVEDGESVSVLGPNGVGKSTLFKCILGLNENYEGDIYLDNKNLKDISMNDRAKIISYIPQKHSQTYDYSVLDIVLMGCSASLGVLKNPGKREIEQSINALSLIEMDDFAHRTFSHLSGGEQQMTLIARAIAQSGKILIMDEPTSALDFGNVIKVYNCIEKLNRDGYTVIQSTHQPNQVYNLSDKVLMLKDGEVFKYGCPCDVINKDSLTNLYDADIDVLSLDGDSTRVCVAKNNLVKKEKEKG